MENSRPFLNFLFRVCNEFSFCVFVCFCFLVLRIRTFVVVVVRLQRNVYPQIHI